VSWTYEQCEEVTQRLLEYKIEIVNWYEPHMGWTLLLTDVHGDSHNLMTDPDKAAIEKMQDSLVQAFHKGAMMADKHWCYAVAPNL